MHFGNLEVVTSETFYTHLGHRGNVAKQLAKSYENSLIVMIVEYYGVKV